VRLLRHTESEVKIEVKIMEFLAAHWHCVLPIIGLAAYLLCAARERTKSANMKGSR
jgi:hypothetical protein